MKGKGKLEEIRKKDLSEPTTSTLKFEDEEVTKLIEKVNEMEAKAKNGILREADTMLAEIFEEMKTKKFPASQKISQCNLFSKIVKIHNERHSYNEALEYTIKIFDVFNPDTSSTKLKIEVCVNSAIALIRKNQMAKAKVLIEMAVALGKRILAPSLVFTLIPCLLTRSTLTRLISIKRTKTYLRQHSRLLRERRERRVLPMLAFYLALP